MKRSKAYVDSRREAITELLEKEGQASVLELADHFEVSSLTIRRDLDFLEKRGISMALLPCLILMVVLLAQGRFALTKQLPARPLATLRMAIASSSTPAPLLLGCLSGLMLTM